MPRRRDQELLNRIGARIRQARSARGLSQQDLAAVVGIEPETLSRVETGTSAMSLTNLARLAQALEVSLGSLLDDEQPLPQPELPVHEIELLRLFRGLDQASSELAMVLIREIAQRWPLPRR
jgi:transcriptional regulator with XRE-family HTH domain